MDKKREQRPAVDDSEEEEGGRRHPLFGLTRHVRRSNGEIVTTTRVRHEIRPGEAIVATGGQAYKVSEDGSLRRQDGTRGMSKKERIRLRRAATAAAATPIEEEGRSGG